MGPGVRTFADHTQARAPERLLLAIWQVCGSAKKFRPVEGTWQSHGDWGVGGKVPPLGTDVNALGHG